MAVTSSNRVKVVSTDVAPELTEHIFMISYDATDTSLAAHEINAKELGEAILGMHNLIEETIKVLGAGSTSTELKVTTPVKEGSVEVVFALMAVPKIALAVLATIGFAATGVALAGAAMVELVKKTKGKKIRSITIEENSAEATIHMDDGEDIVADKYVAKLVANPRAREALHKIIQAPLLGKPDAMFKVMDGNEQPVWLAGEEDIAEFKVLPAGTLEEIDIERKKVNVNFSQINFDSSKGWRIKNKDGEEYPVSMRDLAFLETVRENKQAFRKDDLYEIDLEITTTSRPTRSTIDRVVIEVTHHWANEDRRQV